jgi:predicted NUDIX family NTP pyrophosphohydrolase
VTDAEHWDFPKGGLDEGETPIACAVRELIEETGFNPDLTFPGSGIKVEDLGRHRYTNKKDVQLFYMTYPRALDISKMTCTTTFTCKYTKAEKPEMDSFMLETPERAVPLLSKSMQAWVVAHVPRAKDIIIEPKEQQ